MFLGLAVAAGVLLQTLDAGADRLATYQPRLMTRVYAADGQASLSPFPPSSPSDEEQRSNNRAGEHLGEVHNFKVDKFTGLRRCDTGQRRRRARPGGRRWPQEAWARCSRPCLLVHYART